MTLLLALGSLVGLTAATGLTRAAEVERDRHRLVTYDLRFPRDLSAEAVEAFLTGWTGSLPPFWKRWLLGVPFMVTEVQATSEGIAHRIIVPRQWSPVIESLLGAHLPNVRYTRRDQVDALRLDLACEYRLNTNNRLLDVDAPSLSVRLLASMQPLGPKETVVVQYLLGPGAPTQPARVARAVEHQWLYSDRLTRDAEATSALRAKQLGGQLMSVGRIGVAAAHPDRARVLLRHVESSWHGTRAPGVHLRRRVLPSTSMARRTERRQAPILGLPGAVLNVSEAAGLIGFPVEIEHLPGLTLTGSRLLPVSASVASTGLVVGVGTFPSTERPVALGTDAVLHHTLITGPTGSGKSVLSSHLAVAAARAGMGVIVIDPKDGQLVASVAATLDEAAVERTIVVDPSDMAPAGFDPLASAGGDSVDLVVDRMVSIMTEIWGRSNFGPRSTDLVRHTLLALAHAGLTIAEAPLALTDQRFRTWLAGQVADHPDLADWFGWFNSLSDAERNAMVAPPLNKLRAFVGRPAIRDLIAQDKPAVDFADVLNTGKVALISLPEGVLGREASSLIAALAVSQIYGAVTARGRLPVGQRRPALVIIDELASVLRLDSGTVESFLTQARGYRVGLVTAAQHLDQAPTSLAKTLLANCRSKIVLAPGRADATTFAKEFGSVLTAEDLLGLDAFEAVATVFGDGKTQAPASIRTLPPPDALRDAAVVLKQSRERHGRPRSDIDRAARARRAVQKSAVPGSIGRKRRDQP